MTRKNHSTPPPDMQIKSMPVFLVKADETTGIVEAVVSVFGVVDFGRDIIHPGAFTKTITERAGSIKVVDQHNTYSVLNVLGKPLGLKEIGREELPKEILVKYPTATGGLWTETQYLLDTPEGLGAFNRIKANAINEYSIGYEALDFDYGEITGEDGKKIRVRNLRTIKLWEYSPVIWGMNPATMTVAVKGKDGEADKELTPDGPIQRLGDYLHGTVASVFSSCVTWLYTCGYLSEEEWKKLNDSMMNHLDEFRNGMDESVALIPLNGYIYLSASVEDFLEAKAGRTLSARNMEKIRNAVDSLTEVLKNAGFYDEADEIEEEMEEATEEDEKGNNPPAGSSEDTSPTELKKRQLQIKAKFLEMTH